MGFRVVGIQKDDNTGPVIFRQHHMGYVIFSNPLGVVFGFNAYGFGGFGSRSKI